jgi:hypothetical protein
MSGMQAYYVALNEAFNKKSAKNRNEIDDTYFLIFLNFSNILPHPKPHLACYIPVDPDV